MKKGLVTCRGSPVRLAISLRFLYSHWPETTQGRAGSPPLTSHVAQSQRAPGDMKVVFVWLVELRLKQLHTFLLTETHIDYCDIKQAVLNKNSYRPIYQTISHEWHDDWIKHALCHQYHTVIWEKNRKSIYLICSYKKIIEYIHC